MKAQPIEVDDMAGAYPSQHERPPRGWVEAGANDLLRREANRQLGENLGVASHELKTPLTVVQVNVQLALLQLGRCLRAEAAGRTAPMQVLQVTWELLKRMERQVDRLSQFMDELLDVSRIEAGKLEITVERCDLAAVVSEAVAEQRLIWPARRIAYDPAPEMTATVPGDARRIGQVVTNYLTNALKYAPDNQPVEVWLEVGETEARVCVRDMGPGVPAAEQERIWERFQQVEGINSQGGTDGGLGLHISRTIIQPFQGEVGLESAPGQGATFWCTLPPASATEEAR
jgi:signal transduction histidine kinase